MRKSRALQEAMSRRRRTGRTFIVKPACHPRELSENGDVPRVRLTLTAPHKADIAVKRKLRRDSDLLLGSRLLHSDKPTSNVVANRSAMGRKPKWYFGWNEKDVRYILT
jgi:hypothetical protein